MKIFQAARAYHNKNGEQFRSVRKIPKIFKLKNARRVTSHVKAPRMHSLAAKESQAN